LARPCSAVAASSRADARRLGPGRHARRGDVGARRLRLGFQPTLGRLGAVEIDGRRHAILVQRGHAIEITLGVLVLDVDGGLSRRRHGHLGGHSLRRGLRVDHALRRDHDLRLRLLDARLGDDEGRRLIVAVETRDGLASLHGVALLHEHLDEAPSDLRRDDGLGAFERGRAARGGVLVRVLRMHPVRDDRSEDENEDEARDQLFFHGAP
jgi:hypothetical protein